MMKTIIILIAIFLSLSASDIESEAKSRLGDRYVWGGADENGFDCSGFSRYVYRQMGYELPRTALEQSKIGKEVNLSDLKKGDLLFFKTITNGRELSIGHVGIYLAEGQFIHSSQNEGVVISSLDGKLGKFFAKAIRVLSDDDALSPKLLASLQKARFAGLKINCELKRLTLKDGKYAYERF